MSVGLGLNVGIALGAMGGAGGAPDFFLPLTSSLIPLIGVGSPTFARNTTATVWGYDNSGNWTLLTIPAGTPRFEGARWTGSTWTNTFPDGSAIPDATLKGYLAEGQRTNLLTYSEQFDNAAWIKYGAVTVTANAAIAPDGTMTADKLSNDANNSYLFRETPTSILVVSFYAKADEYRYLVIDHGYYTSNNYAIFDLLSGTVSTSPAYSGSSAIITPVGNGWYRCSLISANSSDNIMVLSASSGNSIYSAGNGTYGLYIWGAQLEQASFASSYGATTNTTTTRNADALSYLSSLFSDTAGTAYVELTPLSWANVAGGILGDGTNSIIAPSNSYGAYAYDGANTANGPSISPSGKVKAAIRWGNGKMRVFANGMAGAESNYDGAFSLSSLLIGANFYGNIKNVKSWYNRILSDYQCQKMTA